PFTPAQLRLSDQIIRYWSRFAATGTPNTGSLAAPAPHWPRFTAGHQEIQELVPDATAPEPAAAFSAAHQCAFWQTIEGGFRHRPGRAHHSSTAARRASPSSGLWPLERRMLFQAEIVEGCS